MYINTMSSSARVGYYYNYANYICDTEADIQTLPKHDIVAIGSKAFVVETSANYILSPSNEWRKVSIGSGGGGVTPEDVRQAVADEFDKVINAESVSV